MSVHSSGRCFFPAVPGCNAPSPLPRWSLLQHEATARPRWRPYLWPAGTWWLLRRALRHAMLRSSTHKQEHRAAGSRAHRSASGEPSRRVSSGSPDRLRALRWASWGGEKSVPGRVGNINWRLRRRRVPNRESGWQCDISLSRRNSFAQSSLVQPIRARSVRRAHCSCQQAVPSSSPLVQSSATYLTCSLNFYDRITASLDQPISTGASMTDPQDALCPRGRLCRLLLAGVGLAILTIATFVPVQGAAQQQPQSASAPTSGIAARWDFSSAPQGFVVEQISSSHDPIVGVSRPTISPVGPALQMDGYTTAIHHASLPLLAHASDLSISCWLQLEAYPWNEVPILDQDGPDRAVFFGVDAEGHLIASLTAKTELHKFASVRALPLRQWTLVTFTAARDGKVALYIGGQSTVAQEAVTPIASG